MKRLFRLKFLVLVATMFPLIADASSWRVTRYETVNAIAAQTNNSNGDAIGQMCFMETSNCVYGVSTKSSCEKDAIIPVLLVTGSKTLNAAVHMICMGPKNDGSYLYALTPFESVDLIIRKASYVRLAMPLENGKIKVVRFSLLGSSKTIAEMRRKASVETGSSYSNDMTIL